MSLSTDCTDFINKLTILINDIKLELNEIDRLNLKIKYVLDILEEFQISIKDSEFKNDSYTLEDIEILIEESEKEIKNREKKIRNYIYNHYLI